MPRGRPKAIPLLEGKSKGGINPPDNSSARPPAPEGSGQSKLTARCEYLETCIEELSLWNGHRELLDAAGKKISQVGGISYPRRLENVTASINERLLQFAEHFVEEWEDTWVDPDDQNHGWSELYAEAKQLIRDANGGHIVERKND